MSKATKISSVLFADIAGSTRMYELLGNDKAKCLIVKLIKDFTEATEKNRGEVIQTIGDEVMCLFPDANDAVNAATDMHKAMDARPSIPEGGFSIIGLYIRIDTGPVIREGMEIFGYVVNAAAKMKALSKPRQTLITQETRHCMTPEFAARTRLVGTLPIKGKAGRPVIYEYVWEDEDVTIMREAQPGIKKTHTVMVLKCGPRLMKISDTRPVVSIGRMLSNDLVINYPRISRMHARIEHRRSKFVLVDASSNGTYVRISGKEPVYLKHDELQLYEEGIISPGREASPDSPGAIHFSIQH